MATAGAHVTGAAGAAAAGTTPPLGRVLTDPLRLAAVRRLRLSPGDLGPAVDRLARLAARALGASTGLISIIDDERQVLIGAHGLPAPWEGARALPLDAHLCPVVLTLDTPLVVPDLHRRPDVGPGVRARRLGLRAYLGVHLCVDGQVVGTLSVTDPAPQEWTADQVELLRELAESAVSEVRLHTDVADRQERAELADRVARVERHRSEHMRDLAVATERLVAADSVADTLRTLSDEARALVGAHQAVTSLTMAHSPAQTIAGLSLSARYAHYRDYDAPLDGSGIYRLVVQENRAVRMTQAELEAHPMWRGFGAHAAEHPPMRGWLAAPLVNADGTNAGMVQLSDKSDGREFDEVDEALLVQLTQVGSVALQKAQLLEQQRHIAHTLQQSLLPPSLPRIDGVELAARYHPSGDGVEVGGDFYDVFETAPGDWSFVIGDVCGKGPEAASVTALTRHTVRAAAVSDPDPASILRVLNDVVRRHPSARFCTVLYLRVRLAGDEPALTIASAGHPLPLLVGADGSVGEVGRPGTLLGVVPQVRVRTAEHVLRRGQTLVLLTDGVTEAHRPHGPQFEDAGLHPLLAGLAGRPVEDVAQGLLDAALAHEGGRARDDIATIVLRPAG